MDSSTPRSDAKRRRRLLSEGRTLTRYVLGRAVPGGVLRRYVRAVSAEDDATPLELSPAFVAWPRLLRAAEPLGAGDAKLRRRLALATRIVEFTREAAPLFHNYTERSRLVAWSALASTVAVEALLLPSRLLSTWLRSRRRGHSR